VGDDSHLVFRQRLLGVKRDVVIVKHPGLFSPKFGATSSHVFTQSPQNVSVEPGINSLACLDRCFALPQLMYRWRHQTGMFWIPPLIGNTNINYEAYTAIISLQEGAVFFFVHNFSLFLFALIFIYVYIVLHLTLAPWCKYLFK
jgi:hypothetical protein